MTEIQAYQNANTVPGAAIRHAAGLCRAELTKIAAYLDQYDTAPRVTDWAELERVTTWATVGDVLRLLAALRDITEHTAGEGDDRATAALRAIAAVRLPDDIGGGYRPLKGIDAEGMIKMARLAIGI